MSKQKPDTSKKVIPEKPEVIKLEEKLKPDLEAIKNIQDEHSEVKLNKNGSVRKPRKSKAQKEAEKITDKTQKAKDFSDSITGVGSLLLSIMVERMPQPKPLTELEKNMFDNSFNKLAYKYAEWLGDYSEETAFVLVTAMIIIPRVRKPKKSQMEIKQEKDNIKKPGITVD